MFRKILLFIHNFNWLVEYWHYLISCFFLGWMILVILIYHVTGGNKHLPLYMHIQVLISSYLFLTGYEHFQYMWSLPHNSIERSKTLFIRFFQVGNMLKFTLHLLEYQKVLFKLIVIPSILTFY